MNGRLALRLWSTNKRLADALDDARHEAAMERRRADRWRRTALEMAPRIGPKAMSVCLFQVQSDEIEALPETKEHR